ncbi:MAG: hypothetical protein ABWX85_03095 [Arthrobacter sp.]
MIAVAALTLAGCGGTTPPGNSSTSSTPNASSSAPSPTPTPKSYSNEDLTAIVSGLKDSKGQALTVIPAAQIDQGLITAKELLKTAVITPPECGVLADNNAQVPEGSTYAAGTTQSAADQTAIIITVFAVKDPSVMAVQFDKSQTALGKCAAFSVQAQGQEIAMQMQPLEVKTSGEKSLSVLSTQSLATGQKQMNVQVTGVKGTLAVTVVKAGAAVSAESAPELVQLVNDVLGRG